MARKGHTPEQILGKLRRVEVVVSGGKTIAEATRAAGISRQTYYRWRNEYGGLGIDQAREALAQCRLVHQAQALAQEPRLGLRLRIGEDLRRQE